MHSQQNIKISESSAFLSTVYLYASQVYDSHNKYPYTLNCLIFRMENLLSVGYELNLCI